MKSWIRNRFTDALGIHLPIVQGPFGGGLSSVALTATVSAAGGLGSFGVHHLEGADIIATASAIRQRTDKPFALNLWLPFDNSDKPHISAEHKQALIRAVTPYFAELDQPVPEFPARFSPDFHDQMEAVLETRPAVFSFVYGVPSPDIIERCKARNIKTLGAATTVDEAVALEQAGVDMVVASGCEAGGHRVAFLRAPEHGLNGTLALVPQVVDAVRIPVIAAGGIADGRGIAAVLTLGASAAQIGTAFLACDESGTTDLHRAALFSLAARDTRLTKVFSGRLARGLHNRLIDAADQLPIAPYPIQNWLMGQLKQAAIKAERADLMSLWAGQGAPLLRQHSAQTLMQSLVEETEQALSRLR